MRRPAPRAMDVEMTNSWNANVDIFNSTGDDRNWLLLLHARQELKTIVFLLVGVIVMLGVVAGRIGPG